MALSSVTDLYDEDIIDNQFFQKLRRDFGEAYQSAVSNGWIICVPRSGSYRLECLSDEDVLSHILLPQEGKLDTFMTFMQKEVKKRDSCFIVNGNDETHHIVRILFSETCYSDDLNKHTVCCLEAPLAFTVDSCLEPSLTLKTLSGMHDCLSFLWAAGKSHHAINAVNKCCGKFVDSCGNSMKTMGLQQLWEKVGALYSSCVKIFCEKGNLEEEFKYDSQFAESLKLALETYVLYLLHPKLLESLLAVTAADDAKLNKTVQNLQDLQPCDLNIPAEFTDQLQSARQQMGKLVSQHHPWGKFLALKKAVKELESANTSKVLSSDDLLPIFVLLVVRVPISSWMTQLIVLKMFHFSASSSNHSEYGFLVATLEAAVEHIKSGALTGSSAPEALADYTVGDVERDDDAGDPTRPRTVTVQQLFQLVARDQVQQVEEILQYGVPRPDDIVAKLCHPLCDCDRCRLIRNGGSSVAPTLRSEDGEGRTALHVAAANNAIQCLELLVMRGARLDVRDYTGLTPLHCACQHGHQAAALMLLHMGASMSRQNLHGNTPLHLAANNGHEACVKALVYFSEQTGASLTLSCPNLAGDSPLHLAARWGYSRITDLLVTHGAPLSALNRRKQSPLDVAHDHVLRQQMQDACQLYRNHLPKRLLRLRIRDRPALSSSRQTCQPTLPPPPADSSAASDASQRAIRRLFAAISARDERLACFLLGIHADTGAPVVLCHPLCDCERCGPLSAAVSPTPQPVDVQNSYGRTPLHAATAARMADLIRLLLRNGANPNAVSPSDGATPLHCACSADFPAGIVELVSGGADVNAVDKMGRTALHIACSRRNAELCQRLLRAGADPSIRCGRGLTPLESAGRGRAALAKLFSTFVRDT